VCIWYCKALHCVALVCCSVVQCVALCCSVLQALQGTIEISLIN